MKKRFELLKLAVRGREDWQQYLAPLSHLQLEEVKRELQALTEELRGLTEKAIFASDVTLAILEKRENDAEKARKKQRRMDPTISLRQFLTGPISQGSMALADLLLCTKTGATLRLEELTFNVSGVEQTVKTVNKARELFQAAHVIVRVGICTT